MERSSPTDRWLEALFRLHPGELRPTLLMFLQCHALVGAFVVARSVRDTLFLARVSAAALPWVYILGSVAVVAAGAGYTRFLAQRRLDRVMPATALAFAGAMLVARLSVGEAGPALASALYAGVEVMGAVTLLQFWSFAGAVHDSREAKRLFSLIAAGGTLAGAAWGLAVGALARSLGLANLLGLVGLLLVAGAGLGILAVRAAGPRTWAAAAAPPPGRSVQAGRPDRHTRALGVLVVFTFLTVTLVDYQFKLAASAQFGTNTTEMARYFGLLAGGIGAVSLLIQLGFTNRILERLGVAGTLALLPAAMALGSAGMLAAGGLLAAALTKAAEQSLRYTANDAAMQLLYVPLPAPRRSRAKAAVDGVVRPATIAAAGALLLAYPRAAAGARPLALSALLLSLLWLVSLVPVHRGYLGVLRDTLRRRRLDLPDESRLLREEAGRTVRRALASGDPAEVEGALALAPQVAAGLGDILLPLLGSPSARIRTLACQALASGGAGPTPPELLRLLADGEPEVRAAAIAARCALAGEEALPEVRPFLSAPEPAVRGAAVAGLIRHGGLDGILAAADALKALLASPRGDERIEAARVLGRVGLRSFYQPLHALLSDPDPAVRRAALEAAGHMRRPELLSGMLRLLGQRETARAAAEAIVEYGPGVEPRLAQALADPREDAGLRRRVARILGRLGTDPAAAILVDHVDSDDEGLRGAVALALGRALRRRPRITLDRERVGQALRVELLLAWRALSAAEALGLSEGQGAPPRGAAEGARHLLATALSEKVSLGVDRALILARVVRPELDRDLELARARLADRSPLRRAAAVEMLDSVLDQGLRRRLVPLVDARPRSARLRDAEGLYDLPRLGPEGWMGELLRDEGAWLPAVAAHAAGRLGLRPVVPRVRELLQHPSPVVRESALGALERLLAPGEVAAEARQLTADPFEPTRAHAAALIEAARRPRREEVSG